MEDQNEVICSRVHTWKGEDTKITGAQSTDGGPTFIEAWRFGVLNDPEQRFCGLITLHNRNLNPHNYKDWDYPYDVHVERIDNRGVRKVLPVFNCRSERYARRYINDLLIILCGSED